MKSFIILMAAFMAAVAMSIDTMLPALGLIGRDLGVAEANHVQYILVLIFAGMAAGQLVCGPISDAVGRKRVLYAGLAVYALGSVVCLYADTLPVMLAGRLLQGLGVSGPYVSALAIVRDRFSGAEMARIMSLIMMIFVLVPSVAPMIGQAILFFFSWRHIFALLLAVALALAVWVRFGLEETLPPERRIRLRALDIALGFREVFSHRETFAYMVCMGLMFGGFVGYLNSTQQIFQGLFQTGALFSAYFGGLALVFGASSLLNARVVERFGMRPLCRLAATGIIVASLLFFAWCFVFGAALVPFLVYVAMAYFAMGLLFGNLNALAMEPMGHIAGIASAVIGATSSVISLVFGTLIGQAYDGTLYPVTAGFLVLGAAALFIMRSVSKVTSGGVVLNGGPQ